MTSEPEGADMPASPEILREALQHGAATAVPADRVLPAVLEGGRRRRLRNRVAAGGAVAVAVAAAVAVAPAVLPEKQAGIPAASAPTVLVPAPDNPPSASFDVDLLPPGWAYIGGGTSAAVYAGPGQPRTEPDADFRGRLVAMLQSKTPPLDPPGPDWAHRVNGHPAAYWDSGDTTIVWVDAGPGPYVVVQVPRSIGLSEADLLRLAGSVGPRENAEPGKG
jgi:hypothetical protein